MITGNVNENKKIRLYRLTAASVLVVLLAAALITGCGAAADSSGLPTEGTVTPGAYKLTDNVQLTGQLTISGAVTIDLNGYTITAASGNSLFRVDENGDFTLQDSSSAKTGKLKGNGSLFDGGGGVYVDGGKFTMTGGSITGCAVKGMYGVSGGGGGVLVNGGEFTMSGGSITGCTTYGGGGGVGVYGGGKFTMSGGSITGCTAEGCNGGGVYVDGGTFTMSSGEITNCAASGNYGVGGLGGGVFLDGGTFTMSGGSITGCAVSGNCAAGYGGGVCVWGGTFTMSGGSITGCTAELSGSGVCVFGGTFTISGSALVNKTNDVYLPSGYYITYGGTLNKGAGVYNIVSEVTDDGTVIVSGSGVPLKNFAMGNESISLKLADDGNSIIIGVPTEKIESEATSGANAQAEGENHEISLTTAEVPFVYQLSIPPEIQLSYEDGKFNATNCSFGIIPSVGSLLKYVAISLNSTNITVANTGDANVTVNCSMIDEDGVTLSNGSEIVNLPVRETAEVSRMVNFSSDDVTYAGTYSGTFSVLVYSGTPQE